MSFRDDYERKAHDIICLVRYGGYGGKASDQEIRKVADIIRGHTLDIPKPKLAMPKMPALPVVAGHTVATPPIGMVVDLRLVMPTIKLP